MWAELIALMEAAGVMFASGLTDAEILHAEDTYGFRFPPDLREFLQTAFPKHFPFPNWRAEDDPFVREMLRTPLDGIIFDVEQNHFWLPEWGPRPVGSEDRKAIVEAHVDLAPRLIPIYSHRMMADRPHQIGSPVLSVHQTDIIYYGFDLDDYFRHEFNLPGRKEWPPNLRTIEFWDVERWQNLNWS